jgi:CRP-like cAMP-binding protein
MGGETTLSRAVVESPGSAYRLKGQLLKHEFHRAGPMQRILMRYTQALLTEMAQTLVCVSQHSLDQQFCRWLLLRFDRLPSNNLVMSQELIANLLGVHRGAISEVAVNLRKAGLIKYHRSQISLLDRHGIEARACECYATIKEEYHRLFPKVAVS